MTIVDLRGRRAAQIENTHLRVTMTAEGGHIAEIRDKASGVNPLWAPRWPSIEPSMFGAMHRETYGRGSDARLLAGILGHNICLDIFGGPSAEEEAAGLSAHGEAAVAPYAIDGTGSTLVASAVLPLAGLAFERHLALDGRVVHVVERVTNTTASDRPIAWTQHVTLGPPFLEHGLTQFAACATRSKVFEGTFGPRDYLRAGDTFDWPMAPRIDGGMEDLRRYASAAASSAYTAHLMDSSREEAFFVAFSPTSHLSFGYTWRTRDFPWLGIWEENRAREWSPWDRGEVTRGMEFGVSPFPETRRAMVDRARLFDVPTYRWIAARSQISVEYRAELTPASQLPDWSQR
jgi:hypothetical protein